MLIDFHTHAFPLKVSKRAIETLEHTMQKVKKDDSIRGKTDGTVKGLLNSMDENNVSLSVVLPIATNVNQFKSIFSFAKEITDKKRIISFGSVHPDSKNIVKEIDSFKEAGFKGIKLHPEFQHFYVNDKKIADLVRYLKEIDMYAIFHCGCDYSFCPPCKCSPDSMSELIEKTGGENIICAHMGGFLQWEYVYKYIAGSPCYLDTSLVYEHLDKDICKEIIKKHSAGKVLFGSDSPWQRPKDTFDYIKSLDLPKEDFDKITYKNAKKLLDI